MTADRRLDPRQLLEPVVAIARRAGAEILEVYASGAPAVTAKADDSPLTIADLRSHRLIVRELSELTPSVPVLSEESAEVSLEERRGWKTYWLIDPLDGTKEFLSRNGEFTVNIALIVDRQPVLGVVYVPVRGAAYSGVPGYGAFCAIGPAVPSPISVRKSAPSPVRVVGSKSHRGDSLDGYLARLGAHELVSVGSSLKLCLVAEGSADLYPRLGPTCEWDTAAAHAVVLAAGGAVIGTNGAPLTYNKSEMLNPHFIVYADTSRDWLGPLSAVSPRASGT